MDEPTRYKSPFSISAQLSTIVNAFIFGVTTTLCFWIHDFGALVMAIGSGFFTLLALIVYALDWKIKRDFAALNEKGILCKE